MCADGLWRRTHAHRSTDRDRHRARCLPHARRGRQEVERIAVAARTRVANAEVEVRGGGRGAAGRADSADPLARADRLARAHRHRREVQVRRVEPPVGAAHRHRQSRGADKAREPDASADRSRHRRPNRRADVDPAVLAVRVRPTGIGEGSEDATTYRPPPRVCHRRSRGPRPERRGHASRHQDPPPHGPLRTLGAFRRHIRRDPPTIRRLSMLGRLRRHCRRNLPSGVGGGWRPSGHAGTVDRRRQAVGPPSPRCFDHARTPRSCARPVTQSVPNRGDSRCRQ
jgi:hypothetical protein